MTTTTHEQRPANCKAPTTMAAVRATSRLAFALLAVVSLTRCPADTVGQRTMSGPDDELPPPMRLLPAAAETVITNLRKPESVLHDPEQDVYFISNINGGMLTRDDNGFISRVDAKTLKVQLKWIDGAKAGVRLDGPKGLAILGDALYVSDVTAVRKFDRRTGRPLGEVPLPGATFINDITTDGRSLYVSDTGMKMAPGITFARTGTDAIWKISGDRATKLAAGRDLDQPNGLDHVGGRLRVVTFGGSDLYELDGVRRKDISSLPAGQLDGLVHLGDGRAIVTSWIGDQIYREGDDGRFEPMLAGIDAPADIGYDSRRNRLLVPYPTANYVSIHRVGR